MIIFLMLVEEENDALLIRASRKSLRVFGEGL